jgi:DNA-binding HxlR family transcriptional regulator
MTVVAKRLYLNAPNGKKGAPVMRKTSRKYGCPVEFAADILSGKWKTVILSRLKIQPMRYGELRHDIPTLSDRF